METTLRYLVTGSKDGQRVFETEGDAQSYAFNQACKYYNATKVTDLATKETWDVYGE